MKDKYYSTKFFIYTQEESEDLSINFFPTFFSQVGVMVYRFLYSCMYTLND